MEQTNSDENLKSPTQPVENFSPTVQYQYEEAKAELPEPSPTQDVTNFQPEDEIIIKDETDDFFHRHEQPQEPFENEEDAMIIREVVPEPENIAENPEENPPREENQVNERERNLDAEFYQHSLHHLVQNLNNLRDTLQTILTNTDLAQELGGNAPNNNAQNPLAAAQQMPNEAANNEGQLQDQLLNLRRMLGGNANAFDFQGQNLGMGNQFPLRNQENNQPRLNQNNLIQLLDNYARQFIRIISKDINALFWVIFGLSMMLFLSSLSNIPDLQRRSPDYLIEWLAFHKSSTIFLLGGMLIYICLVIKFCHLIYNSFMAEPGDNFYKIIFVALWKYSPFFDIGLYIFVDSTLMENKLEVVFMTSLLIWCLASNKIVTLLHQRLNQAQVSIHQQSENTFVKMKRVQFVAAIYLLINIHVAYGVIWLSWYSSFLHIFVLASLSLLSILEPLKVFLSGAILVKNYSVVSNNNTRELSDPKFKVELLIDLIHQFDVMLLIGVLGLASDRFSTAFLPIYWLSLNNSIERLKNCYHKYLNWSKLQKRIDEVFPIVERSTEEPEELCTICHENLLIARKLQCGHVFHLKCLIYWLENQKTCPNCRASVNNINEIIGNNRPESAIGRFFNQITGSFRSIFS